VVYNDPRLKKAEAVYFGALNEMIDRTWEYVPHYRYDYVKAAQSRHAAEREALVRKCLTIATDYEALCGESFEMKYGTEDIQEALLALLSDSGSQG
jgi:uncharacterized protein with NRDE domain